MVGRILGMETGIEEPENLYEEIIGDQWFDEDDHEVVDKLNEWGANIDYEDRANDQFFVYLYFMLICSDLTDHMYAPVDAIERCQILRDVKQSDGEVYPVTFRFENGYDLACRYDSDDEVFIVRNGKCVTNAPMFQFLFDGNSRLTLFDAIDELKPGAHLITECETVYPVESEDWCDFLEADDLEEARRLNDEEREKLKKLYD